MGKRKYPKVSGYWVYSIQIKSNGKYYIGVSGAKECSKRWFKKGYEGSSLEPYLEEFESMIKTVLIDGLSKEEAYKYEDNIIRALNMNNLCLNTKRSGLIEASDINAYRREYMKQWHENNPDYNKQYYEDNREREKQRKKQWKQDNKEKIRETNKQYREKNKEKINEKRRQRRLKKKLEKQNQNPLPLT